MPPVSTITKRCRYYITKQLRLTRAGTTAAKQPSIRIYQREVCKQRHNVEDTQAAEALEPLDYARQLVEADSPFSRQKCFKRQLDASGHSMWAAWPESIQVT